MANQLEHLKTIYRDYRDNKLHDELLSDWGSVVFYRPLAIVLAWILAGRGISPNAVTGAGALSVPCFIVCALVFPPATAMALVIAAALLYLVLDCTDGTLARATGQVSVAGHYWDLITDIVYRGFVYVTVGYLADQIAPWSLPVGQATTLAMSAWLATVARLARYNLTRLTGSSESKSQRSSFNWYSFFSGLDTLFPLLTALACWTGHLHILIAWIFMYSAADVCVAFHKAKTKFENKT